MVVILLVVGGPVASMPGRGCLREVPRRAGWGLAPVVGQLLHENDNSAEEREDLH